MREWARTIGSASQRPRKKPPDRTSRYWGVAFNRATNKYVSHVRVDGETIHIAVFEDERAAAIARDRAVLYFEVDRPLNLPRTSVKLGPASPQTLRGEARRRTKRGASSRYFGVSWNSAKRRWAACVWAGIGRHVTIAMFVDEEDAAVAYDRVTLGLYGDATTLNFAERDLEPASIAEMRAWSRALRKMEATSRFRGVSWNRRREAWVSHLTVCGKGRFLGWFDGEEEAARAYDRAALQAHGGKACPNFHPHTGELLLGSTQLDRT